MSKAFFVHCLIAASVVTAALLLMNFRFQGKKTQGGPGEMAQKEPTVEQVKKNIQVLKGLPASQLIPVMNLMAASLNVECIHCHVADSSALRFELDDKRQKGTARKMIQMVMDMNEKYFNGRHEVTCFTCHHGSTDPVSMIPINPPHTENREEEREEEAKLPTSEAVITKYENALGGSSAIANIKSRITKGIDAGGQGRENPIEMYQKAPGKYMASMTFGKFGGMSRGFDGTNGWATGREGVHPATEAEKALMLRDAPLFPVQRLSEHIANVRVRGVDTVNGRPSYILSLMNEASRERYCIDTTSGLLLRRVIVNGTPIGDIPNQTDYEDYRIVDGVKIPFAMKISGIDQRANITRKITAVEQNTAIDDSKFAMPEGKK